MKKLQNLLPGEDLFGLLGRSYVLGNYCNFSDLRKDLCLSHYRHSPGRFLSRDFATIAKILGKEVSQLNDEHTCFNMLKSTLSDSQLANHTEHSKSVIFHKNKEVVSQPWRWCAECAADDISLYGVTYYHRDHQVPGVKCCHKHQVPLIRGCGHCHFEVTSIKVMPVPPVDGICPRCGHSFDGYYVPTPTMQYVEQICIDLANGRLDITHAQLSQRVCNYIGIAQEEIEQGKVGKQVRSFYRQVMEFYSMDELQGYFYQVFERKSGVYCPALQTARIYDRHATSFAHHPLVTALIWHFLNEQESLPLVA